MKYKIIALVAVVAIAATGIGFWAFGSHRGSDSKSPASAANAAPSIQLDIPASGILFSQDKKSFQIAIRTGDYKNIARVEYLIDGNFVTYSTTPPFTVDINISALTLGKHTLQALAYDMSGRVGKSAVFTFTVAPAEPAEAADDSSQAIVNTSDSIASLTRLIKGSGSTSGSTGSGSSGSDNGGGNNGGDNGGGDTTPWPDTPAVAQVCGNTALLNGPASAPQGAIVLPAGDNSGIDLEQAGKTYWFAPGTHTIGSGVFSQIAPANNSTYVGAPGAILSGQGVNQYAFSAHGTNVKIQYLTITNFNGPRDEGVVNHDSGVGWTMEYNTLYNDKGGALFAGTNNVVRYNCLRDNGQYGFQVYSSDLGGPHDVLLDHNEISGNNTDDWESQINGCGCTGGGKFWEATNITVTNNYVHDNLSVGLWADTNDNDFLIEGNYISGNESQGLFYEISYNMTVRNNNFVHNGWSAGAQNNSFPTGAIYLSESGGDPRVSGRTAQIDIHDNNFDDNWAGIILWENADRYCNSPANTSSGVCTLVSPSANLTTCNDPALGGSINTQPYKSDCRWKTQNVKVHNNIFKSISANITGCTTASSCGYQGIFSNVGTFPSWSPYMGSGIQDDITFHQNNLFSSNTYLGDWRYKAVDQSTKYNFAVWQYPPFSQDTGSTYNGQDHLVIANAIDDDTATLENGLGEWQGWFSSSVSRSTAEAHSGTHSLKVDITAPFGWGVQLSDPNGPPITPSAKNISYWAKLGSGTGLKSRMEVKWLDVNGSVINSSTNVLLPSPVLTSSWQKMSTTTPVTPPSGARTANVIVVNDAGAAGTTGNVIYLDDFVIGDAN